MSDSTFTRLSVLVPVYNEARTLRAITDQILKAPVSLNLEVVMVDDGSTDDTWEIASELAAGESRIKPLRHDVNRGKGAAIRTAITHATGEIIIVQDADLEYDPAEIGRVIAPILEGRADAVFGSRFASSPVRRVLFYWHSLGNKFLTLLFNVFNDLNLTDMETGYKAVRTDVVKELRLQSDRFGIEPEISTRLAQWGARIYEVPISYHGRTYAEGKHIGWRDGLQALWLIVKFRFIDTEYSTTGEGSEVSLSDARSYARWVVDEVAVDLDARLLEVDAGVGNFTRFLLGARSLTVVDDNPRLTGALRRKFGRSPTFSVVEARFEDGFECETPFDRLLSFNGLATASNPERWLSVARDVIDYDGTLHLLVPAHAALTSVIDESMLGRRRFDRVELADLLTEAGFEPIRISEFNRLGALGWRVNDLLGLTRVGRWQARVFSLLVPLARFVDRIGRGSGLSFVVEARPRS